VPGLLHRDPSGSDAGGERRIRAVVLALPGGTVQAQDTWTVHDRVRYLWMLQGGRFLLRDRNSLFEGGASLAMKSLFDFPGSLLDVEFDPGQQLLVTNSHEPVAKQKNASASAEADEAASADGDLVVRILRRTTGQLLLVSRARSAVHLSINSEGYLEGLRGQGMNWMLNLDYFTGGSRMLGGVESTCMPDDNFITDNLILAIGCGPYGESWLTAMTTAGRRLWKAQTPSTAVWPQLTVGLNGQRLALATLDISHSIDSFAPIGAEDVKEQSVTVFDSATGDIALVSPLSPILDAGGNVAISPSGRRVALLNAGAIQIFELGAPPALPAASAHER
jgi:WD40 repeat protein